MIRDLGLIQSCDPSKVNTPPAGQVILFRSSVDGFLYQKNSAGTVSPASAVKTYKALLTEAAPATITNGPLVVGVRYAITTFVAGDDFSNVAEVESGTINVTGCVFIATGTTPTDYSNGSTLDSDGAPVATILENSLSGTPIWSWVSTGIYKATLTGAFTAKSLAVPFNNNEESNANYVTGGVLDVDTVEIEAISITGNPLTYSPTDGFIGSILIEVYP